jgi:hypothetical protein
MRSLRASTLRHHDVYIVTALLIVNGVNTRSIVKGYQFALWLGTLFAGLHLVMHTVLWYPEHTLRYRLEKWAPPTFVFFSQVFP